MLSHSFPTAPLSLDERGIAGGLQRRRTPVYLDDGNNRYFGGDHAERIFGKGGNDFIDGGGGNDVIKGGGGNDSLHGNIGSDYLIGGVSNDYLYGGRGHDYLYGGQGADYFGLNGDGGVRDTLIYASTTDSSVGARHDIVRGFDVGVHDKVDLTAIDADTLTPEDDRFHWIGDDVFSGKPGELRYDPDPDVSLLQADVNGDGVADFEVYFINSSPLDLTAHSFEL